jgi:hypothetical protein
MLRTADAHVKTANVQAATAARSTARQKGYSLFKRADAV